MKQVIASMLILMSLFSVSSYAVTKPPTNSLIDLNHAQAIQIQKAYKGMGMRRAKAIVAYRDKNGPYHSVAELEKVKSVGKGYVKRNLKKLTKVFMIKVSS